MYLRTYLRNHCNIGTLGDFAMLVTLNASDRIYRTEKAFFEKKSIIHSRTSESEVGGIIRSGCVFLEYTDPDGIRRILDFYNAGDIYLKKLLPSNENYSYSLVAQTKVSADLFYSFNGNADSESAFPFVIDAESVYEKAQGRLLAHLRITCQHTLEKKLLCLFDCLAQNKKSFTLPMSLTDCADFIGADRSSMMREIGKLEKAGVIRHKGRRVELIE